MTEASLFYEAATTELGKDFLDDVQRVIDSLREHPYLGLGVDPKLRRMPLRRFPFNLIYSVESTEILIVAVAHHGRRPGYWKDRVE
jgi:plasmid stabilization system protein ParE